MASENKQSIRQDTNRRGVDTKPPLFSSITFWLVLIIMYLDTENKNNALMMQVFSKLYLHDKPSSLSHCIHGIHKQV